MKLFNGTVIMWQHSCGYRDIWQHDVLRHLATQVVSLGCIRRVRKVRRGAEEGWVKLRGNTMFYDIWQHKLCHEGAEEGCVRLGWCRSKVRAKRWRR